MATDFDDTYERYMLRFGEAPRETYGMDDSTLERLMLEALKKGQPISDEDYERHVPKDAFS